MTTRPIVTRASIRTPKAAAVAGIVFAVLLSTALILIYLAIPADSRDAGEWVVDDGSRRTVRFALNLLPFSGIAFLWFVGVVRDRIGVNEDRFFATVFLGSGLLFVAMLFAAGAVAGGLLVPDSSTAPTDETWSYGRRVTYSLIAVYAMRMAGVFMISTTTLLVRLRLVPRWVVWFGYVGAVVMLLTTASLRFVEFIFPLWVVILSLHILAHAWRSASAATERGEVAPAP